MYFGDLNHLVVCFLLKIMNLMNVTEVFISYTYNCCRIFFPSKHCTVVLWLVRQTMFQIFFSFSDPATETMCGLWKCWNLICFLFFLYCMVFCVPGKACMYHYVFCDNKRIWIKKKKRKTTFAVKRQPLSAILYEDFARANGVIKHSNAEMCCY